MMRRPDRSDGNHLAGVNGVIVATSEPNLFESPEDSPSDPPRKGAERHAPESVPSRQGDLPPIPTADEESLGLLALASIKGVGYRTLYSMFRAGLRFRDVVMAGSSRTLGTVLTTAGVRQGNALADAICNENSGLLKSGRQALDDLNARGIRLLHHFEPDFPSLLQQVRDVPGWLFVEGDAKLLRRPSVAIVGSRKANEQGIFLTRCLCYLLSGNDICTVSGLAEGIDREVHFASIEAGVPTIGVLGTGIDNNYPASSVQLREEMLRVGGCIVSEYLPSDQPDKTSFVWRNRIQAGLSPVTIPAQWQIRSGTAHTVRFAIENSRFVVGVKVPFGSPTEEEAFLRSKQMSVFSLPHESEQLLGHLLRHLER
jgi:DNA processing protein